VNREVARRYGLMTQFLHAHRIVFERGEGELAYLAGRAVSSPLPQHLERIRTEIFGSGTGETPNKISQ
jgi:hypothetical protein